MKSRRFVMAVSTILLISACTTNGDPDATSPTDNTSSADSNSPSKSGTETASDSGVAEVDDITFTALGQREGNTDLVFAIELTNTSESDLLHYTDLELTWSDDSGETKSTSGNNVLNIQPGDSVIYGQDASVPFEPTNLEAEVITEYWYPVANVAELGLDFSVDIIDSDISVGKDDIETTVQYSTNDDIEALGYFYPLLVIRDSKGEILGTLVGDDVISPSEPDTYTSDNDFSAGYWPDRADPNESEIVLSWACCVLFPPKD